MNILLVSHYHHLYGSIRSQLDLAIGLQSMGISPFFVIPRKGTLSQWLEDHRLEFEIAPIPWWMTTKELSSNSKRTLFGEFKKTAESIQLLINRHEIDLVYTNTSVTPVGSLVARRMGIPHIWHIREFGDLDFSLNYVFPKWLCRRFIRASSAVICNSKAVCEYYFGTRPYKHSHMIYNGVATRAQFDQIKATALSRVANPVYTFAIVGSLSVRKGQDTAIHALARLIEQGLPTKLIVVGSGREPAMENLRARAEEMHVSEHVEFTGYIADPYQVYFRSDCLLMCSEYEAFGRVTAEAMSACLPVIGKNSGGTPEVISDGDTGFLYNSFEELVEYMTRLVRDRELGRRMGLAGWQRAKEMFNIEDYAANVYKVIQSVMKQ